MTAIATNNSTTLDSLLSLLRSGKPADAAASSPSAANAAKAASGQPDAATELDFSDHAQSVIAKAKSDHRAAVRLEAFVAAQRASNGKSGAGSASKLSVASTLELDIPSGFVPDDLNGITPQGNFSADDGTIYTLHLVPTGPGTAAAAFLPVVEPKISFSTTLQAGGYSIVATGDARDGTYSIDITGPDGFAYTEQKLQPGPGIADYSQFQLPPGGGSSGVSGPGPGNSKIISFNEGITTAASVTASSDAGSLSVSSASARALMASITINFSTGSIQLQSSSASASSQSARLGLNV